ncbi:MAG: hypothetical protein AAF798_17345 [Bacteroidota bacterium]
MKQAKIFCEKEAPNVGSKAQHPLFRYPLFRTLFDSFAPQYVEDPVKYSDHLDTIQDFLFFQKRTTSKDLESLVGEPLYTALRGLQSLLKKHNSVNVIEMGLELSKLQFKDLIDTFEE